MKLLLDCMAAATDLTILENARRSAQVSIAGHLRPRWVIPSVASVIPNVASVIPSVASVIPNGVRNPPDVATSGRFLHRGQ